MKMDPEKFHSLGMGQYYECPLNQVKLTSDNKWNDFRVTLARACESQTQTISPVFRIASLAAKIPL